jgi:hypothetical protein
MYTLSPSKRYTCIHSGTFGSAVIELVMVEMKTLKCSSNLVSGAKLLLLPFLIYNILWEAN